MSIRTGSNYHDKGGEIIEVAEIIQHPDYNGKVIDYDVSLLKVRIVFFWIANIIQHTISAEN